MEPPTTNIFIFSSCSLCLTGVSCYVLCILPEELGAVRTVERFREGNDFSSSLSSLTDHLHSSNRVLILVDRYSHLHKGQLQYWFWRHVQLDFRSLLLGIVMSTKCKYKCWYRSPSYTILLFLLYFTENSQVGRGMIKGGTFPSRQSVKPSRIDTEDGKINQSLLTARCSCHVPAR